MKKIFAIIMVFIIVLSVNVLALGEYSYNCKVTERDMSGAKFRIYFINCRGHYYNDTVTVYVTNTSKDPINVQVSVGYGGGEVQTSVESGYVELESEVTGRFVLEHLSAYPEKANDDLGYVPGSALGENSVVIVELQNAKKGDTFVVSGIDQYGSARNTSHANFNDGSAIQRYPFIAAYVNESKLVVKDKEKSKAETTYEYTLEQPDNETVIKFLIIVTSSAVLCVGGLAIYIFSYVRKRRENND